MKKITLLIALTLSLSVLGQSEEKNELKLNAFNLIALSAIDITYERLLTEESAIGTSLYVYSGNNQDEVGEYYKSFSITPYYRNYFSKNYAKGFFVEAFAMLSSRKKFDDIFDNPNTQKKESNFAMGIAVGGKWVTKKGFLAEISIGIGRNLFQKNNDEYYDETPIVGRGGISIGKRF